MIGQLTANTNDIKYRDVAEYATMVLLSQVIDDLRKQGVKVTPSLMCEYRDAWSRDGKPMDFTTMNAKPSDFVNLLRSTGVASFGKLDTYTSLDEGVKAIWSQCVSEYNKMAEEGRYLHVVTDPEIRSHVLDQASETMSKAFFVHKRKSLRELSAGDAVLLYDRVDTSFEFSTQVVTPETEVSQTSGFSDLPVAIVNDNGSPDNRAEIQDSSRFTSGFNAEFGESLLGWFGGTQDAKTYRGLSHIMGAYITKADAEMIAKNIDPSKLFDADLAHNAVDLLKHMRSNGYDFTIRDNGNQNQIEARMSSGENINVRIFDADANGSYIGRIYDAYNSYYYNVMGGRDVKESTVFKAEDSIALLDYVTGHKTGRVTKSVSKESSRVQLDGISREKSLQIQPIKGRYRSLVFTNQEEAREYIENAIQEVQRVVDDQFRLDDLQSMIDRGLDDDSILYTGPDFQAELENVYALDPIIRDVQQKAARLAIHSDDGGLQQLESVKNAIVGTYDSGFNPAFVIDHMMQTGRGNERDAMMAALKVVDYDMSLIKGNDFAVNAMRERLVTFDPSTAKTVDQITNPILKAAVTTVQDTLNQSGITGTASAATKASVVMDDNGIIRWEGNRRTGAKKDDQMWQSISGEIGQIFAPNADGIIETKFQGQNNYGIVPGYTGYFSFEGDYDDRMSRFRAKGFEQHLTEQLRAQVSHQVTRPFDRTIQNIPTTLDSSSINGLYHGDVYGKRIDIDFMESSQLNMETKAAILKTLSSRVRFDNQFSDYATTSAETQAMRETDYSSSDDISAFSYWKVAGETNMRVLNKDIENYADTTMTGTGKTQGLIWYLTDGATVNSDGSVTPSKGMTGQDGSIIPDKTALQKLPYFDKSKYNAWDRNQMSSNQLLTALRVDENVNTALIAFGGWTFEDSYAVSKEFADRNKVFGEEPNDESIAILQEVIVHVANGGRKEDILDGTGMVWSDAVIAEGAIAWGSDENSDISYDAFLETHGRFRSLARGDKLSDFGGNKGTIGIIIDRHMPEEEAKAVKLDKEVRFLKANPSLDVISAPYSMMSRHNAGVVKELMDGEVQDLVDPDTGEVFKAAMGQLNIIVTDMTVDKKTHAYTKEDVLEGKGRKASGQLAWALQSKKATGMMNEIYGRNDSAWTTLREYLITTGMDMAVDGTILTEYTPHMNEERQHFEFDSTLDSFSFLDRIKEQGGFLDVPSDLHLQFKNGLPVTSIPVLSASLRQNVELVDGSMRRNDFTNHYVNIYDALGEYTTTTDIEEKHKAAIRIQEQFDKIQSTIIDRQFNGGHNGKHSYIRDKIMGKAMEFSATGVMMADPRLPIGHVTMNQAMLDSLDAKENDMVALFRDPVWRDGALRSVTVHLDESVNGVGINPSALVSHDGDLDGDTAGLINFKSKEALHDLETKFSHWSNMIDVGNGKDQLYFQTGMDFASAEAKAKKEGDTTSIALRDQAHTKAMNTNPKVLKSSLVDLNKYTQLMFRHYGFGGDYVSLESDDSAFRSFKKIVDIGAKGSPKKLEDYMKYHKGQKTDHAAREIQYASGVKSDDTGLAGAFSQKLVAVMRNDYVQASLESMYPLTQGTLQIKHDADHSRVVNEILTDDLNKLFRGKDIKDPRKNLTPQMFKAQLMDVMENKMKVNVNEKFIDAVTETLTHDGKFLPLKEAMAMKGSPMDRVAYGGGYDELIQLSLNNESLLTGNQSQLFAPFTMRNNDPASRMVKKDTLHKEQPVNRIAQHNDLFEDHEVDSGIAL